MVVNITRNITLKVVESRRRNMLRATWAAYAKKIIDGPTTKPFQPRETIPKLTPANTAAAKAALRCSTTAEIPAINARGVADESLETRLFELATGSRSPAQIRHEANQIRQSREIQNRIKGLEAKGCQVTYRSVDVRQLSELSKVLDEARERHGEVRGIIHGAGVLADGWILEKSDEDFRKVWETKVQTARHLLSLCNADQLRLIQFDLPFLVWEPF